MSAASSEHERLLAAARDAARAAAAAILEIYAGDFVVEHKDDHSPVTQADVRAEAIIIAALARAAPAIPAIAEEQIAAGTFEGGIAHCHATTRKGKACQRTPLPDRDYCPSHQHLERSKVAA